MKHLNTTIAAAAVIALAFGFTACGKSKSKDKKKADDKTSPAKLGSYTCEQVAEHLYPIMNVFRSGDKSQFGVMTKNRDQSPAAVKKHKAAVTATCKQRKHTQPELHCYMTTQSLADIGSCAAIWRARLKAETKPAETKPAEKKPAEKKPAEAKPADGKPAVN